ncbi:MAG: hypothetical protein E6J00_14925, partial [Chloroflexi bacterium]
MDGGAQRHVDAVEVAAGAVEGGVGAAEGEVGLHQGPLQLHVLVGQRLHEGVGVPDQRAQLVAAVGAGQLVGDHGQRVDDLLQVLVLLGQGVRDRGQVVEVLLAVVDA